MSGIDHIVIRVILRRKFIEEQKLSSHFGCIRGHNACCSGSYCAITVIPWHDVVYAQTSEVTDDATLFDLELLNAANVDIMPQTGDDVIFAPTRMTYSVRAASETNKVTVNPTKNNLEARIVSITPPDRDQAEGHQVALTGGSNTVITVTVASEDSTVTERYTVTVYQVRTQASDDAELSLLSLSDATLSPRFASAKTSYTGRAAYSTDETTVSYTEDIGATVTISAQPTGGTAVDMDADPDASGYQVALEAGVVTDDYCDCNGGEYRCGGSSLHDCRLPREFGEVRQRQPGGKHWPDVT